MHTRTNVIDFPRATRQAKLTVNLIAQLAVAGHAVHKIQSGGFLVCKQGMSRFCENVAELRKFATLVGADRRRI